MGSSPFITSNRVPEPRLGDQAGPHGSLLVVAVESQHLFIGGAVRAWAGVGKWRREHHSQLKEDGGGGRTTLGEDRDGEGSLPGQLDRGRWQRGPPGQLRQGLSVKTARIKASWEADPSHLDPQMRVPMPSPFLGRF